MLMVVVVVVLVVAAQLVVVLYFLSNLTVLVSLSLPSHHLGFLATAANH